MILNWPTLYIIAIGISLLLTSLIIPWILHVAYAKELFDRPNERKVHQGVVPRLGGIAFFPVIILTVSVIMAFSPVTFSAQGFALDSEVLLSMPEFIVLFAAMAIMFVTGLLDDLFGLKYGMKFVAQILTAVLIVFCGNYISDYQGLFGIWHVDKVIAGFMSGFLIIYIVNSLNLIDGIDGLASGLCIVTLVFFGIMLFMAGEFLYSLLAWAGTGSLLVFWFFNVFGNSKKHTKIFMGDIGSLTLGLFVAFLVLIIAGHTNFSCSWSRNSFILALSPLVLPLFDVIRVFFLRVLEGKSPFLPDKKHIHHIMLNAGVSMRASMVIIILLQIGLIAANVWLAGFANTNLILLADFIFYMLIIGIFYYIPRNNQSSIIHKKN